MFYVNAWLGSPYINNFGPIFQAISSPLSNYKNSIIHYSFLFNGSICLREVKWVSEAS